MYCVRKLKNWKIISWDYSIWIWILLIVLAIMFLILMYNKFDVDNLDFTIIPGLLPFLLMLWAWIFLTIVSLKILRAKNLRNNWKWILKKIKVTWIAALYKKNFSWCYLIFKDGNMITFIVSVVLLLSTNSSLSRYFMVVRYELSTLDSSSDMRR